MKLEQSFEVAAPLDRVWKALVDVEHVAPCLPGAAVTGRNDDGSYVGTFTVKIGPTTASYTGTLQMENVDEATHSAKMHAHGSDKRGQGGADADISSSLSPIDSGTHVEVITDYHITGRLARFGRGGMIEDISERLLRQFAERLQASLVEDDAGRSAGAPAPPPAAPEAAAEGDGVRGPEPTDEHPPKGSPGQLAANGGQPGASAPPSGAARPPQPAEPLDAVPLMSSVIVNRVRKHPAPAALLAGLLVALLFIWRARRRAA